MALDENTDDHNRLKELSESNYEIADGQPDIQGWDVENSDGVKIGEVDELLFDSQAKKVRYIVLDTDNNDLDLEDGHVLIPIGVAELNENDDTVLVPGVTVAQLIALPLYERGRAISPDIEAEIRAVFTTPDDHIIAGDDFYDHTHFNQTKFYAKRWQAPIPEDHLLTEGEDAVPPPDSAAHQKYNRDNIIP